MKIKIQKKIFAFGILISALPIAITSSLFLLNNVRPNETNTFNNAIESKIDNTISTYSLGTTTETKSTYTFLPNDQIPWANTKKADEISSEEIKSILIPSNIDAIFHVEIKSINLLDGIITFELIQTIRTFTDGKVTKTENQKINAGSGSGSGTNWTTPTGLIVADKYHFEWRSNQDIGLFLKDTNLKPSQLTKEIVIGELIKSGGNFKLPDPNNISVAFSDVSSNSRSQFGVVKVVISFSNTQSNSWINNTAPTEQQRTLILRGMNNDSGQKVVMNFSQLKTSSNIGGITIQNKDIFGNVLLANENIIGDLYPSEFVSLDNGNIFSLINMFQKGTYLQAGSKLIDLVYMGASISDNNFATTTGIDPTTVSQLGLYNIISEPNDLDGSLKLVYEYKYYDVFSNSVLDQSSSQIFAPKTFKVNPDTNKSLVFSWKTNTDIQTLGSSYDIINSYFNTINNANLSSNEKENFKINYANNFFIGSNDVYAKTDRKFDIEYKGGTKVVNGAYVPSSQTSSDYNQIKVTITFNSWNGYIYEENNVKKDGYKTSIIYTMPSYQYSSGTVIWKKNDSINDLLTKLPSEIAYDISKRNIDLNRFFTTSGLSNIQTIVLPNDSLGSLNFKIIGNANNTTQTYQNVFVGFSSNNIGSNVIQFGWAPQIGLPKELLNKTVNEVTDEEIMNYFISNNPLFQSGIISQKDISVMPDVASNSIYIKVTFDFYNQDLAVVGNQTFYTQMVGFKKINIENIIEVKEPLNLTLILSVSLAALTALPLLIYFIVVLTKFIKYAQSKKKKEGK
ncbi:MAG: hypothetical protein RSA40_00720 [Malacoplasma sp.]